MRRKDRGEPGERGSEAADAAQAAPPAAARRGVMADADLRLLADSALDFAMVLTDPAGAVARWSRGAEHVLGWAEDEMLGRSFDRIFTPEDRAAGAPDREREAALRDGRAGDERWHLRKGGSRFWGSGVLVPLFDPDDGALRGFGKILRDETARRRAEEGRHSSEAALRVANATLEEQGRSAAQRQDLVRRVVAAQEEERRRLSRELHDELGQLLTAFALGLRGLEDACSAATDLAAAKRAALPGIARLRALTEGMGREVHRLAVALRPTALDDLGLVPALAAHIEEWERRTGVPATFEAVAPGPGGPAARLPSHLETTIYRVVQESLTNAARHAVPGGATRASVTLQWVEGQPGQPGQVLATVEDDGPGFEPEGAAARGRLGLVGMRERAEAAGGTLEVESEPGGGATVFLRLPVDEPVDEPSDEPAGPQKPG